MYTAVRSRIFVVKLGFLQTMCGAPIARVRGLGVYVRLHEGYRLETLLSAKKG